MYNWLLFIKFATINLLDTYFFKTSVILNWLILGFNIYCYSYYKHIFFLVAILISVINLGILFYEDYELFNLIINKNIFSNLSESTSHGQLCFDIKNNVIFCNNAMKQIINNNSLENFKFDKILDIFKHNPNVLDKIKNSLEILNKENKKVYSVIFINGEENSMGIEKKIIFNKKLFFMDIAPKTQIIKTDFSIIEDVIQKSLNGYLIIDNRQKIIFANDILCKWLGCVFQDIKYLNIQNIVNKNILIELFDKDKKNGSATLNWKGNNKQLNWSKETILGEKNTDYYVICQFTPNKNIIEDNRETEIVSKSSIPIISFKNTGEIQIMNNSFLQMLNNNKKNSLITDFFEKEMIEKILSRARTIIGDNFLDIKIENKEFKELVKKIRIFPIDLGGIKVFIIVNITEFLMKDQQLLHAQRLMTTGEVMSGVIHDLNNYLMPILGYTESIFSKINIYDPIYSNMMHLQNNAIKVSKLVQYLLNMSRKNDSKQNFISDINSKIAEFLRSTLKIISKNIEVKFNQGENIPTVKIGDIYFGQILTNLLINSRDSINEKIAYKPQEKGFIYITTEMTKYNPQVQNTTIPKDYIKLTIIDNGMGIASANLKKIFDPFYTTKKNSGIGLGLATVRTIVTEHEGVINIDSKEGIGTTIQILLPTEKTINSKEKLQENNPYITGNTDIVLDSGTILILEDEQSIRRLLREQLQRIGYDIIDAENGRETLEKVEKYNGEIDVFISDVMLSDMSLVELCNKIKKKYPNIVIILSSGTTEDQVKDIVGDSFEYTFFSKPFPLKSMFSKIQILKKTMIDKIKK